MRTTLVLVLALAFALNLGGPVDASDAGGQSQRPVKTVRDGVLDEIAIYVEKLPATPGTPVVMRAFSGLDANLGTGSEGGKQQRQEEAQTIKAEGPKVLAERFVATLQELGPYTSVSTTDAEAAPAAGSIVIEGKFTKIDPGSRAKRYFVGFGAGKSTVSVSGSVRDAAGAMLATFEQTRHGVMGMGGGDSLGKLLSDSRNIGEDLARFVSAWANQKSLK